MHAFELNDMPTNAIEREQQEEARSRPIPQRRFHGIHAREFHWELADNDHVLSEQYLKTIERHCNDSPAWEHLQKGRNELHAAHVLDDVIRVHARGPP